MSPLLFVIGAGVLVLMFIVATDPSIRAGEKVWVCAALVLATALPMLPAAQ